MQKDLTEVKILQKVLGGYFFETPCDIFVKVRRIYITYLVTYLLTYMTNFIANISEPLAV